MSNGEYWDKVLSHLDAHSNKLRIGVQCDRETARRETVKANIVKIRADVALIGIVAEDCRKLVGNHNPTTDGVLTLGFDAILDSLRRINSAVANIVSA